MAKKLISIDDEVTAGVRLPAPVRTEIAALPAVTEKLTTPTGGTAGQVLSKTVDGFAWAEQVSGGAADALYKQLARTPESLIVGAITFDANGAAISAPVVWPDGTVGTYTADTISPDFPSAVDGYKITYGNPATKIYTQPTMTRNAAGAVTAAPAITVSAGGDFTTGLKLHWTFDDLGLAEGAAITNVPALVGGYALTPHATVSKQPTIHLNAANGHAAARFVRANAQYLRTALFAAQDIIGQPATQYTVFKRTSTAAAGFVITGGVSGVGQHMSISAESATNLVNISAQNGGSAFTSPASPDINWHAVGGVFDGAWSRLNGDGSITTGTVTKDPNGGRPRVTLGSNAAATATNLDGEILEVRVYNRALTTQDVAALRSYAQARYAIA